MKAHVHLTERLSLEVEGESQVALFDEIAKHGEVFGIGKCGACKSSDIRFVNRTVSKEEKGKTKNYQYRELHCNACRARLSFGQHQEGGSLFPRKKGDDGEWLPNNGWTVYKKPEPANA